MELPENSQTNSQETQEQQGLHEGRDKNGKFAKGFCPTRAIGTKKKPGEIIDGHEKVAYRDSLGRWIPGVSGGQTRYKRLGELRQAMIDASGPKKIAALMDELFTIAMDKESGRKMQIEAMELYFDRVLGKPTVEMFLEKQTTQTKINVDFKKLSEQELHQMQTILEKTQAPEIVVDYNAGG